MFKNILRVSIITISYLSGLSESVLGAEKPQDPLSLWLECDRNCNAQMDKCWKAAADNPEKRVKCWDEKDECLAKCRSLYQHHLRFKGKVPSLFEEDE